MKRFVRALLYGGILGIVLGLGLIHATQIADPPYGFTDTSRFAWSLAYAALLAVAAYSVGLPDLPRTPRAAIVAGVAATAAAAAAISLVQLFIGDALLPRFVVFGSAMLLIPWFVACVGLAGSGRGSTGDRVLVLAAPEVTAALRHELHEAPERDAAVVGTVAPGAGGGAAFDVADLATQVRSADVTVLVLDRDAQSDDEVINQAMTLHAAGIKVRTLSLFYEQWLGKLPISELERVALLFDIGEIHESRYPRLKRILDLLVALPLAIVLALLLPFVVLGNLVANRGPLFYRQVRVGKGGTEFTMYKLRSMRPSGGEEPSVFTATDDERVTPFGRFLRTTHLDELPQVINIVRGDLSLVGPRPEQPHYVDEFTATLPFYDLRHLVRPGLTGWAQVKYHYGANEQDATEKLQYEFYYLRHQRLSLDLRILGRTLRSVVRGEGR